MNEVYKNSYLQSYYEDINPRLINRCVQRALDFIHIDEQDLDPPFNRLTSEQPNIPVKNIDVTRRPLGYGREAMRKLRRELHSMDSDIVIAAIESISDLAHDPEYAYEAVNLKVIDRIEDLLIHDVPAYRERAARTLAILSRIADGREAIVTNKMILQNLQMIIEDPFTEVRMQVAALLEMIARFWKTADVLIGHHFIPLLLQTLQKEEDNLQKEEIPIVAKHLLTLKRLMYGLHGRMIALDADAFNICIKLLDVDDAKVIGAALGCLTCLTETCIGEKMAREVDLLTILNRFLHNENPLVYTQAASTIMFCTVKTLGKIAAVQHKSMTKRLVHLAGNRLNSSIQIYAIKALTNICEHPDVRKDVKKNYINQVEAIQTTGDLEVTRFKDILLGVIGWASSSST